MAERYEPIAMTLREVAERLNIGKTSAHRLVTSGEIRGFRIGSEHAGSWRVLRSDFDAYVDSRRAAAEAAYQRARAS